MALRYTSVSNAVIYGTPYSRNDDYSEGIEMVIDCKTLDYPMFVHPRKLARIIEEVCFYRRWLMDAKSYNERQYTLKRFESLLYRLSQYTKDGESIACFVLDKMGV